MTNILKANRYDKSPFIECLTVSTRGRKVTVAKGSHIIDMHTGEIEGTTEVVQVVDVDEGQFVKLFTKDLAVWFDLNKAGIRVFGALLRAIQKSSINRDLVYFDYNNESVSEFNISTSTFYRGVDELLSKGFIARHKSAGLYFINPSMFFNGNRARFVKEYRVRQQFDNLDKKALSND